MTRVAIVIGTSLAFALIGLLAGHLCVSAYSGGAVIDGTGSAIRFGANSNLRPEFVLGCYLGAPVAGAILGFAVSLIALQTFSTDSNTQLR